MPVVCSSESMEQRGFLIWFHLKFPGVLMFAIPNGEYRAKSTASKLVKEGVVAGIPDLYIPAWKTWVEMKRKHGSKVSKEQEQIHHYLKQIGDTVIVGYGAEDASRKLLEVLDGHNRS